VSSGRVGGGGVLLLCLLVAHEGRADEPAHSLDTAEWHADSSGVPAAAEPQASTSEPAARRAGAIAASIVPGVVAHGSGHLARGKPRTAARLLAVEGVGVFLAVGGIAALALTGASPYTVGPAAIVTITGAGLFGVSWLADVYGSAAPDGGIGRPPATVATLETELGHRYVHDPQFRYRHFLVEALDLRVNAIRLRPSAWLSLDDANARYRLLGAYRFFGPRPDMRIPADGSFLDLELAATHHSYDSDGFRTLTGELFLGGRLDLRRFDRELGGSFGELGFGWGLQAYDYDVPGLGLGTDTADLLLARFAFGVYLGDPERVGGEARLFYDHRHDGFAAGMKLTGLGSGVPGHFGLDTRFFFTTNWGASFELMVGSAWIGGASLLFRQGAGPQ
jgi:hypothetical protein